MPKHKTNRTHFQVQRDVIYALLLQELSSRFGRSRGGIIWVFAEPAAHLLVPMFIFSFIRQYLLPGIDFPVFLVYGFLPFLFFKTICLQLVSGVNAAQGLISYRQVHLMDVFVAKTMVYSVIQAAVFIIVLSGLAIFNYDVLPVFPVELALILVLTITLAFGLGLVFAAIASLIPDASKLIKIMFMPLYFASGILFPITRLSDEWVRLLAFNPVLHLVELTRVMALKGYRPMQYMSLEYLVILALTSTVIGLMLYRQRYLASVTQ